MRLVGFIIALILIGPYLVVMDTWAISTLWGWFLVQYLPVPAFWTLAGIALTIRSIRGFPTPKKSIPDDKVSETWARLVVIMLTPFIAVGLGWIYLQLAS